MILLWLAAHEAGEPLEKTNAVALSSRTRGAFVAQSGFLKRFPSEIEFLRQNHALGNRLRTADALQDLARHFAPQGRQFRSVHLIRIARSVSIDRGTTGRLVDKIHK